MRFKGKMSSEQLSLLYQIVTPLSRIASSSSGGGGGSTDAASSAAAVSSAWTRNGSILYLDDRYVRVSTRGKSNSTDSVRCFAEFTRSALFTEYRIESAVDNNAIVMEVDIAQLRSALQSLCSTHHDHHRGNGGIGGGDQSFRASSSLSSQEVILKLAKRDGIPCLCVTSGNDVGGGGIAVHHSVPVRIRRANEMPHYLPPKLRTPDVQLELWNLSSAPHKRSGCTLLRPLVEGLRGVSSTLYVEATSAGDLTISIDGDGASIRTYYNNLPRPDFPQGGEDDDDDNEEGTPAPPSGGRCTVKVDTRKLHSSLLWQQQPLLSYVSTAMMCLVENEMLVLHAVLLPEIGGFFTYYIPVQYMSHDITEE